MLQILSRWFFGLESMRLPSRKIPKKTWAHSSSPLLPFYIYLFSGCHWLPPVWARGSPARHRKWHPHLEDFANLSQLENGSSSAEMVTLHTGLNQQSNGTIISLRRRSFFFQLQRFLIRRPGLRRSWEMSEERPTGWKYSSPRCQRLGANSSWHGHLSCDLSCFLGHVHEFHLEAHSARNSVSRTVHLCPRTKPVRKPLFLNPTWILQHNQFQPQIFHSSSPVIRSRGKNSIWWPTKVGTLIALRAVCKKRDWAFQHKLRFGAILRGTWWILWPWSFPAPLRKFQDFDATFPTLQGGNCWRLPEITPFSHNVNVFTSFSRVDIPSQTSSLSRSRCSSWRPPEASQLNQLKLSGCHDFPTFSGSGAPPAASAPLGALNRLGGRGSPLKKSCTVNNEYQEINTATHNGTLFVYQIRISKTCSEQRTATWNSWPRLPGDKLRSVFPKSWPQFSNFATGQVHSGLEVSLFPAMLLWVAPTLMPSTRSSAQDLATEQKSNIKPSVP